MMLLVPGVALADTAPAAQSSSGTAGTTGTAAQGTGTQGTTATTTTSTTATPNANANVLSVSIKGLNSGGSTYDGTQVVVEGEAVGDIMNATADTCWVTLTDSGSSISVEMSRANAATIAHMGDYATTGSRLRVVGTFYLADPNNDGLTDVQASYVDVIDAGGPKANPVDSNMLVAGAVFVVVGLLLMLLFRFLHERSR
jgi:hypothetical protein